MAHKGGLGKGLGRLIPARMQLLGSGLTFMPVERILPNPRQPRLEMDPDELEELAASIREHGIFQPLIVTQILARTTTS